MLCVEAAILLGPFALWPALPASDYYGPSAPTQRHRPATRLPCGRQKPAARDRWVGSHVHSLPFDGVGAQLCPCGLATATPQAFTVASLPATSTAKESPAVT
jgi:hypothetical protein